MKTLTLNGRRIVIEALGDSEFAASISGYRQFFLTHSDLWHIAGIKYPGVGKGILRKPGYVKPSTKDLLTLVGYCRAIPAEPAPVHIDADVIPTRGGELLVQRDSDAATRAINDFVRANSHVSASDARRMYKEVLRLKGAYHTYTVALKKLVDSKPRKIPHVRMVRAAALQPGMRIPEFNSSGKVIAHRVVISVDPMGWAFTVTTKLDQFRHGETHKQAAERYAATPPFCRHYMADHVVPVFIEFRDKVAL